MEYINYSQEEAKRDGIGYTISRYSTKMVEGEKVVGIIVFKDEPLNLNMSFIEKCKNKDAVKYYETLNNTNSLLLKKIVCDNTQRNNGILESFFDYVTHTIVPKGYIIWTNPIIWDNQKILEQIGGFTKPRYEIPQNSILLFSINPLT